MVDIYIPTLHTFAMGNLFTGSWKELRFRAETVIVKLETKEVDFSQSAIRVEYWHGPFCYEKSTIEEEASFPLTEEGRLALKAWLESKI